MRRFALDNPSPRISPSRWSVVMALVSAVAVTALTACGSSGSSGQSGAPSTTGLPTDAYAIQSQALLDMAAAGAVTGPSFGSPTADQIVPWKASDMPVPSALTGKQIRVNVAYSGPVGSPPYTARLVKAIGDKLGWQVKIFAGPAPTQQSALQAVQQALLDKPDALVTAVIPGVWVDQALKEAQADGIKTVDIDLDSTTGPGYDAFIAPAAGVSKSLLGAWAVAKSNGTAHTVLIGVAGLSQVNLPAAQRYLSGCAGCQTEQQDFNPEVFVDMTKVSSDVTAALTSRSDVDFVVWPTAALPLQPVLNGIAASKNNQAQLIVDDAGPEAVQLVKSGKIPVAVDTPHGLRALAAIDAVNRLVNGQRPLAEDALRLPVSFWTKDNAPAPDYSSMTAAELAANDWLAPFESAWNVQLKDALLAVKV